MTWQVRKKGRRIRRYLGLPILSRRAWLLVVLVFLGLVYVVVTVLGDFVMKIGQYASEQFQPTDLQLEELKKQYKRE